MPYNADDFKPKGIVKELPAMKIACAVLMVVLGACFYATDALATSPGGDITGIVFGKEVALARKCGFDERRVERFEANQVKAITLSNATSIYIKDALKAFFQSSQDESLTASEEKCRKIDAKMNSMELRYKEGD